MSRESALVTTDWLAEHLNDPGLVIVEVDEDTAAYDAGHIPNAVKLDWQTELKDGVRHDFVSGDRLASLLGEKGISNDDTIVLYGGNNNWFAAYAYWYLKYAGHPKLRLLDGGRKKWELEGRELVKDVPVREKTTYTLGEPDADLRAFRDEVIESIGVKNFIDVRSPDEYAGRLLAPAHLPQEAAQIGGHVPTAGNIPWSKAANEDGTFRSDEELKELYLEQAKLDPSKDTIAYCRIGERSSHTWFVLHEILELPNVKNYDGSWSEYGSLRGVPVAVGDEPGDA